MGRPSGKDRSDTLGKSAIDCTVGNRSALPAIDPAISQPSISCGWQWVGCRTASATYRAAFERASVDYR